MATARCDLKLTSKTLIALEATDLQVVREFGIETPTP